MRFTPKTAGGGGRGGGVGDGYKEQRKEKQFGSAKPLKISLEKNHFTESNCPNAS